MCANHPHSTRGPGFRRGIRNALTNWDQPLPFHAKVGKAIKNVSIRVIKQQTCCGHDGEPGC